jgi:hypothetical protein
MSILSQLTSPATSVMGNAASSALTTGTESSAVTSSAESMANSEISASDSVSKANEAMNMQSMLNSIRKASSELLKNAAG